MSGIDALANIRMHLKEARIIILTTFDGDAEVQRALHAGARSYLLKSMPPNEILAAIRLVHAGKRVVPPEVAANLAEFMSEDALSAREIEVLQQVAEGKSNRDAGAKLFITEETVKIHMKHIMEKLGASDRTQAVAIAVKRGFLQL
jgi:DNA-binding NarL/FixJ family response regulator